MLLKIYFNNKNLIRKNFQVHCYKKKIKNLRRME